MDLRWIEWIEEGANRVLQSLVAGQGNRRQKADQDLRGRVGVLNFKSHVFFWKFKFNKRPCVVLDVC